MEKKKITVLTLCSMLFALSHSSHAQQAAKVPRIGFLTSGSVTPSRVEAFRQGLRDLGYVEGKNIVIEWRSADGSHDRERSLATELVGLKVDVIVTGGSTSTRSAKEATLTIPIVRRKTAIQWATGLWLALRGRVVTLLDCPTLPPS